MCNSKDCISKLRDNVNHFRNEYGVTEMYLFGSVARGDNRPDSDVDILVAMPPKIFVVSALHRFLENLLNSSVDLIRNHTHISPQFINQISRDAIKIF